jgi:hypothetical protein
MENGWTFRMHSFARRFIRVYGMAMSHCHGKCSTTSVLKCYVFLLWFVVGYRTGSTLVCPMRNEFKLLAMINLLRIADDTVCLFELSPKARTTKITNSHRLESVIFIWKSIQICNIDYNLRFKGDRGTYSLRNMHEAHSELLKRRYDWKTTANISNRGVFMR